MNKVLASALTALVLVLLAQQQASAYSKFNFGVGLNFACEGANNSVLWGVVKGGPGPGMADGGFPGGYPMGPGYAPAMAPVMPPSPTYPPMPMPLGNPGVAQPVGYFPSANPAAGYYPGYSTYPTSNYPLYYYYPMVPR